MVYIIWSNSFNIVRLSNIDWPLVLSKARSTAQVESYARAFLTFWLAETCHVTENHWSDWFDSPQVQIFDENLFTFNGWNFIISQIFKFLNNLDWLGAKKFFEATRTPHITRGLLRNWHCKQNSERHCKKMNKFWLLYHSNVRGTFLNLWPCHDVS